MSVSGVVSAKEVVSGMVVCSLMEWGRVNK